MAINPNIALQGQPVNMQQAVLGGLKTGEMIRQSGMRDALMRQKVQAGQQGLQQGQQTLQGNKRAATAQKGLYINQLASSLSQLPIQERAGALARAMPQMQQMGIDPKQIADQDLTDQGLQKVIAATAPFAQQAAGSSNLSVGASEVIQLGDGTPAFARQITDPRTGQSRIAVTPMPGKMVDPLGQTAEQKTSREMEEYLRKRDIDIGEFETRQQLETAYAREKARETETGRAEVRRTLEQDLAQIRRKEARGKELDQNEIKRLNDAINTGLAAASNLPSTTRGLELLERVETGGLTARAAAVTDFFGTTSGDVGELRNILAQNVLAGLANFTGAISEGERMFLERMETNLTQGTAFNRRQLERMQRIYKREVNNALEAAKIAGDDYAIQRLESALNARSEDQGQQSQGQSQQQGGQQQPNVVDWSDM